MDPADPIGRSCAERATTQVRQDFGLAPTSVEGWKFSDAYLAAYRAHPPTWALDVGTDAGPLYRFHCIQWSDGRRSLHLIDRD